MFKKIGISLLLAFTMLVATFNVGTGTTAYATAPCTTLAECRELQQTTRDNIAELIEEEEEVTDYIAEIQAETSALRDEIAELEDRISDLESEISILATEIAELADDIEENLGILVDTEDRIEDLTDEVSQRMRVTQRVNNTNSFLIILSEAESLADFIRVTRTFSRLATEDAELMEELLDLIEAQENLLVQLEEQRDQLEEQTDELEVRRDTLEVAQTDLEAAQVDLIMREADLRERLEELQLDLVDEEEMLEAIAEAEAVLTGTPPPPITTSSSSSSSAAQTPNASGLAHPMPGATVMDEFGSRGGAHRGMDLVVLGNPRAPVLAAGAGTVVTAGWNSGGFGYYVIISHNIDGQRVDTLYGHLRYQPVVSVGAIVSQGQQIGTKGSTGWSYGDHLHFEVHPGGISWGSNRGANPRNWINF